MLNPYTSRNLIKDGGGFFGRQREIEEIFANLETFQNTSIVGERRIGKSSLLWRISQPEFYRQYALEGQKPLLIIFFDLQKVANLTPETFFKLLAKTLAGQLSGQAPCNPKDFDTYQEYFDDFVDLIHEEYRIVICLDEFETITTNDQFENNFLLYLRHFANLRKIAYITSSREPLETICKTTSHLQGSDFWNVFVQPPLYLGLLTDEEARQLVTEPAARAGMPFQSSEVEFIFDLAGRHPLFLQIACFHVFEAKKRRLEANEPTDLTALDRNSALDHFRMGATPHFEHLWERLSQTQKKLIVNCQEGSNGALKEAIRNLCKRGLLTGDPPRPFSQTFEQYAIGHFIPDRNPADGATAPASSKESGSHADPQSAPLPALSSPKPLKQNLPQARLDIWIGRNSEIVINFSGPYSLAQICANRTRIESTSVKRFDSRVRNLPQVENWRLEKQEIGQDVCDLFRDVPQLAQIYTGGRAAIGNDEQFLLTFYCPQELIAFPLEFINCLSEVEEGQRHLALTHPIRKSLLGIRSKRAPLAPQFYLDPEIRILLVSSNVSGAVRLGQKQYTLPEIPGVAREVETLKEIMERQRGKGNIQCSIDVKHNVTREEMIALLQQDAEQEFSELVEILLADWLRLK